MWVKSIKQSLVHEFIEEFHLSGEPKRVADDVLDHVFSNIHIISKVRKRDFWLRPRCVLQLCWSSQWNVGPCIDVSKNASAIASPSSCPEL